MRQQGWFVSMVGLIEGLVVKTYLTFVTIRRRRQHRLVAQVGVGLLLLLFFFSSYATNHKILSSSQDAIAAKISPTAAAARNRSFLHLLIPATTTDLNLCKTLLSAAVLNYSTPTLINWEKQYSDPELASGGSHLAKIPGVLRYLLNIGSENDDDLVVVIDGYDVWFQLKPEILLSRYHAVNKLANYRISNRLCDNDNCGNEPLLSHISQQIIFSTQKLCWPHRPDEIACRGAPVSTLPEDVYGPETDKPFLDPDNENPYLRTRPRYLNSGFVMGPVHAMRRLYVEAESRTHSDPHGGSDQGILSDIFGEQEYAREFLRTEYLSRQTLFQQLRAKLRHGIFGKVITAFDRDRDEITKPHQAGETLWPPPGPTNLSSMKDMEYGVGIDYGSELSHTTVLAPRDADWVVFDSPEIPSKFWHIKSPVLTDYGLPKDIANSAPAWDGLTSNNRLADDNPSQLNVASIPSWSSLPLYTHLWTGNVPVVIHHNAWQRNMKSLREMMWGLMWWNPHAKKMLEAHISGQQSPVIIEQLVGSGSSTTHDLHDEIATRREWWSPVKKKGGARLDNGKWIDWNDLCGVFENTLFMDRQI